MSSNYTVRETLCCPIHQAVMLQAALRCQEQGYFSKKRIIYDLGFEVIKEGIVWQNLPEMLGGLIEEEDLVVLPLMPQFLNLMEPSLGLTKTQRQKKARFEETNIMNPFIASGHHGRTAGYVTCKLLHGIFMLAKPKLKDLDTYPAGKAFEEYKEALDKEILDIDYIEDFIVKIDNYRKRNNYA
jgi:hypothetical protein